MLDRDRIEEAARVVGAARALMVGAGAGMGVDSGLPDFRGRQGFWRAYPPFAKLGLDFEDLANPQWFARDPGLAWGFYGHRLNLYRATVPHAGYRILLDWAARMDLGLFAFTSNVDGHFQRAGYDDERVCECHGSIHHLQCSCSCQSDIWSAAELTVTVDPRTFRASCALPKCPSCGTLARPNILMFGDWGWIPDRTEAQEQRLGDWLRAVRDVPLAVIECGAGTGVPTVRWRCEQAAADAGAPLVRINPHEPGGPDGTISIAAGALEALRAIDQVLKDMRGASH